MTLFKLLSISLLGVNLGFAGWAQEAPPASPQTRHSGTVLFSSDAEKPTQPASERLTPLPPVTAVERNALTFTGYDLEVHLTPAESEFAVHAQLQVRNESTEPLHYLVMELSSSLQWGSISLESHGKNVAARFGQHLIDTDLDHTGKASEAIVALPEPLAAGAQLELTVFYSGKIQLSAERLERIGAPADQASWADWDQISPQLTALRGFGNVLWYPVAAEPVFLGDGAKLFRDVGKNRLRQRNARVHLRLTVQYVGDAPDAAFFCGRREHLTATSENQDVPVAESPGIATAEFEPQTLGFRGLSLFVTDHAPTVTDDMTIAAVTDHYDAVPQYAAATTLVKPLLVQWLGPSPLTQLKIIDHAGQPFEDDAFLVLPMRAANAPELAPGLIHSLAHAWFGSSWPWLDEGVPEFLSLLWTERSKGRDAALAQLNQAETALALAEPEIKAGTDPLSVGQSLAPLDANQTGASDEIYYRTKAAAVLWMLRSLAGDDALQQALLSYRKDHKLDHDPMGFEHALEQASHKDLRWFFDDWVYRDRGLPDLSIASVTPSQLPTRGGKSTGWLVAVDVHNDGDATAEVPVTVRSGELTATKPLRVEPHSNVSIRIIFEGTPDQVQVNDGSVPEQRESQHIVHVNIRTQ